MNNGQLTFELDETKRPNRWPANDREGLLTAVYDAMRRFIDEPGYRHKEVILTLVHNYDANQRFSRGEVRVTAYEVELINRLYLIPVLIVFQVIVEQDFLHVCRMNTENVYMVIRVID